MYLIHRFILYYMLLLIGLYFHSFHVKKIKKEVNTIFAPESLYSKLPCGKPKNLLFTHT